MEGGSLGSGLGGAVGVYKWRFKICELSWGGLGGLSMGRVEIGGGDGMV